MPFPEYRGPQFCKTRLEPAVCVTEHLSAWLFTALVSWWDRRAVLHTPQPYLCVLFARWLTWVVLLDLRRLLMARDPASSWGGESKTQWGSPIRARVGAALPALPWCSDTPLTTWVPPAPCQAPAEQVGPCLFAELPSTQQGCARYLPGKQTPRQNAKAAATTQPLRLSAGREALLQQDPQSRRACR